MSRRSCLVAGFLIAGTTLCFAVESANAQANVGYNRVVSCVESADGNSIVLRMAQRKVPLQPVIQYLPGADGVTLLVADFPGLVFPLSTRIIRLANRSGIQEIHVGLFQESPAVSRVTVVAKDGRALKDVAFHAEPGLLQVKWLPRQTSTPLAAPMPKRSANPSTAPDRHTSSLTSLKGISAASKALSTNDPSKNEPTRQTKPDEHKGFLSNLMAKVKGAFNSDDESPADKAPSQAPSAKKESPSFKNEPPIAPGYANSKTRKETDATQTASNDATSDYSDTQRDGVADSDNVDAPIIEVTESEGANANGVPDANGAQGINSGTASRGNIVIKLKSAHAFTTKSFRISDPERYVLDFQDLPELVASQVPSISEGSLLKSIRIGEPEPGKTRLVLDLSGSESHVREVIEGNNLSLIIDARNDPLAGFSNIGGLTIMLDAGHGGSDPGAQRGDIQEKEITLDIVKVLKRVLEERGARVLMTRADDTFVSLEDRVVQTNSASPTLFLSVHINALESTSDIHGIETYYQTEQSRPLADFIHNALVTNLQAPDRSVRKAHFYVINHTPVPAVLAEVGFISNKDERSRLISSDYQQQVAEALAQGVMLYVKSRPDIAIAKPDASSSDSAGKVVKSEERSKLLRKSFSRIAQRERTAR